jgi:cysteinyl-tRNA synthetase
MLLGFIKKANTKQMAKVAPESKAVYFRNTLSGKLEQFKPLKEDFVRIYSCGPTVYDYIHIGNIRAYLLPDLVRRTLEYNGFDVKHVMNVTDIGHLTSDADEGEDKMSRALAREGKLLTLQAMIELGEFYTKAFLEDVASVNIQTPHVVPRPSDHIPEQIALLETLEGKGYTYKTEDGLYFETEKFASYGALGNIQTEGNKEARIEANSEKHSPSDFALWKFDSELGFESPWGKGFPGWHIECSAMSRKHLGVQIDIHTGGMDLMPIHHNNEIAQSECASGKSFVKYWLHNAFITVNDQKLAKSLGTGITVQQIRDKGIDPIFIRYWLLTGHYRTPMNFSWETLEGAQTALLRLYRFFIELSTEGGQINVDYQYKFRDAINDDLDTPKAIALLWELVKDDAVEPADKRKTLLDFDRVLGLGLAQGNDELKKVLNSHTIHEEDLTEELTALVAEREKARKDKDFTSADRIRKEIESQGYELKDVNGGTEVLDKKG